MAFAGRLCLVTKLLPVALLRQWKKPRPRLTKLLPDFPRTIRRPVSEWPGTGGGGTPRRAGAGKSDCDVTAIHLCLLR
jgi:hypothetical protein